MSVSTPVEQPTVGERDPLTITRPSATNEPLLQPVLKLAPSNEVSLEVFANAARVCLMIVIAAAIGATLVAVIVLGKALLFIGFAVAFVMILFIGMPLMLAAIEDAMDSVPH